jgi:hypothetical protein
MRYFIPIMFLIALSSCLLFKSQDASASQQLEYEEWSNDSKTVFFVSMKHTGHPGFYKNVQKLIHEKKSQGYVAFYEGVKMKTESDSVPLSEKELEYRQYFKGTEIKEDSLKYLITVAKYKRMVGSRVDSTYYSKHSKNGNVAQPGSQAFGFDGNDVNADLSVFQIVQGYERSFGEINLIRDDLFLPIGEDVALNRRLPLYNVLSIIMDLRTKRLSELIHTSGDNKILVVYGKMHKEGVFKELVKRDNNWKLIAASK